MRLRSFAAVAALVPSVIGLVPASGAEALLPERRCGELVKDFDIPGTTAHVETAEPVDPEGGPEYCDVRGYVEPAVRFQLKLPTATFTGRYLQYGCGAFCGFLDEPRFPDCGPPHPGDFAVAATDDGHVREWPELGRWAANNQAARNDWFYRAPHVLSLAAKRIIATYYGSPPTRSYFNGCSNGGREGLLLAQRYPDDFDGIIAGHPISYLSALGGMNEAWRAKVNTNPAGSAVITAAKLPALHNAVMVACDRLDGLVDGPRRCRFDPSALRCPSGADMPSCLTPAQVDAARKLYAGPTDGHGRKLYPGGEPYGSELGWEAFLIPLPEIGTSIAGVLADNYLKYVGYPIGKPHSSLADIRFTVGEFHRLTPEGVKANAMSLDLERFRRSGGKLILWHGLADPDVPPAGTLDYYQRLWQRSGGLRETQKFARLFMVPSMYHCVGGTRLNEFDPFRELVDWVEHGRAPDKVIATGRDPHPNGPVVRTRPVFAYPLQARYDGTGSIDDAGNFVPVRPPVPPRDTIRWVGSYLHDLPGPVAP